MTNPKRLMVFRNSRDERDSDIKAMLERTGLETTVLPTSGPYTLWPRFEDGSAGSGYYGSTQILEYLSSLMPKRTTVAA